MNSDALPSSDHAPNAGVNAESRQPARRPRSWHRISLREYLGLATIAMLVVGLVITRGQLSELQREVQVLRKEFGYLDESEPDQIAAARAPSDEPLTWRLRIRTPSTEAARYRVAYSSLWPRQSGQPRWYGAVPVPPGESMLTVRIMEDPRDHQWKIAAMVGSAQHTRRMYTRLPPEQVEVFRGSHDVVSTGIGRSTLVVQASQSIRLLDERWLVGEGSLLLYGDKPPDRDQIGIYAELQPDVGPL